MGQTAVGVVLMYVAGVHVYYYGLATSAAAASGHHRILVQVQRWLAGRVLLPLGLLFAVHISVLTDQLLR